MQTNNPNLGSVSIVVLMLSMAYTVIIASMHYKDCHEPKSKK
jgi:hypothetical protein